MANLKQEISLSFTLAWNPTKKLEDDEVLILKQFVASVDRMIGGKLLKFNPMKFEMLRDTVDKQLPEATVEFRCLKDTRLTSEQRRDLINKALNLANGSVRVASDLLGVTRRSFYNYRRRLGMVSSNEVKTLSSPTTND